MSDPTATPGWYPDPQGASSSRQRWWDGTAWTDQYAPVAEGEFAAPYPATPPAPSQDEAPSQGPSAKRPLIIGLAAVVVLLIISVGAAAFVMRADEPDSASAVTVDGASLVLPPGWVDVPTDDGDLQRYLEEAAEDNPDLAEAWEASLAALADQGFAMLAFSSELSTDSFATNVNLIVSPRDGATLSDVAPTVTGQLEQAGATNVETAEVVINGVPGLRSTYTLDMNGASGPISVDGIQYLVIGEENAAFLTISSTSADVADDAEAMAQSLEVD